MPNLHWDKPQAALSKIPFTSLRNYLLPEKEHQTKATANVVQENRVHSELAAEPGSSILVEGANG